MSVVDPSKASSFLYEYTYTPGDSSGATHDDDYLYYFPYEHGTKQFIIQGYKGSFSHNEEGLEYALDFSLDEGEKICAARGGIVSFVEESNVKGGPHPQYARYGNAVHIFHSDGSYATYGHLQKDGALVEVGDTVLAGQVIGLAGSTGYARGPHLHFAVMVPKREKAVTVPVKFLSPVGEEITPQAGRAYYAFHTGKEAFEVVFGEDLTNDSYDGYSKPLPETGNVSFRMKPLTEV